MTSSSCLFCGIVAGEITATVVRQDEHTVAFEDISPQAPVHVLVVPRLCVPDVGVLAATHPEVLAAVVRAADEISRARGIWDGGPHRGYRLVFNSGTQVGQSVFHVHAHVLGGRPMGWPPG